jgi:hypothetical protein
MRTPSGWTAAQAARLAVVYYRIRQTIRTFGEPLNGDDPVPHSMSDRMRPSGRLFFATLARGRFAGIRLAKDTVES